MAYRSPARKVYTDRVPVADMKGTVGTWTVSVSSGVHTYGKAAGDDTGVVHFPLRIPILKMSRDMKPVGVRLNKIIAKVTAGVATADAAPSIAVYKEKDGTAVALSGTVSGFSTAYTALTGIWLNTGSPKSVVLPGQILVAELSYNTAATGTLVINGIEYEYEVVDPEI